MNESTAMLTSANPHAEGSKHSNVAFKFSSPIIKEIYNAEKPVANITKPDGSLKQSLPDKDFSHIPFSEKLPLAILRLKQAIGRTRRNEHQKSAVILLDNRISSKRYGKQIQHHLSQLASLDILPEAAIMQELQEFFD